MSQRSVALLHTKEGPWVYTGRGERVTVTVVGLKGRIAVIQADRPTGGHCMKHIHSDGVHEVFTLPWTQLVVVDGDHARVVAFVHCGKAA